MPWNIRDDHPECEGFAVVKSDDGELVACHDTRAQAEKHMAALYANEPEARSSVLDALDAVPNFRSVALIDVDMTEKDGEFRFDGIAAPTGITTDLGDFTEEYEKGSFRKYLAANTFNIPFCHEHDPRELFGTTASGRVKLNEDAKGLRTRANIVKTDLSARIKALVDSGDIRGMSIGMIVGRGNARVERRNNVPHRTITGFKRLLDVCTTFDPAYAATEAQFRSAALQLSASPDLLQQVLMGAYPQLGHGAEDLERVVEEAEEEATPPEGDQEESDDSGAKTAEQRSVAARKRALDFLVLTTGGIDNASR